MSLKRLEWRSGRFAILANVSDARYRSNVEGVVVSAA